MDFNPFLNKLITERNSAVVEDPLVDLLAEMVKAIVRLEAQQETPASASQPTEQPAPSSSEATEPGTGTSDGWSISYSLSSHARADGSLPLSVVGDIWAWCNSQLRHGGPQEVEIGVILTSKASTPPAGSASPSTAEPTPEASGVAGSREFVDSLSRHDRFMFDAGRSYEAELRGDKGTIAQKEMVQ